MATSGANLSSVPPGVAPLWALRAVAALCLLVGAVFVGGGAYLCVVGGSWYFAISGILMLVAGLQLWQRKSAGGWVYGGVLLGSAVWAVWESGLNFWPLFSRLFVLGCIGVLVALVVPCRRNNTALAAPRAVALGLAVALVAAIAGMFVPHPGVSHGLGPGVTAVDAQKAQRNWSHYGNTEGGSRFAALDQINRDNVDQLQVAWTYRTGDIAASDGNGAEDQLTPLQVDDRVFICTPHNNLIALDVDTGRQLWRRDIQAKSSVWQRCRGLAYYDAAPAPPEAPEGATRSPSSESAERINCTRRLLTNTIDARLIAVDAETGEFCQGFGNEGQVDLKTGLGDAPDPFYQLTSPPLVAGTTVVVGGRVADNVQTDMPGGVIRGFDVVSGQLRWAFDPGNPGQRAAPAPGQHYVRSTPNAWAPMSYDARLNTVFIPMGGSSTDLYGAERTPLNHKYGASVLAVDATTGNEKWVYQTVHNDLWDFDLPMQPTLIDFVNAAGEAIPALVIGTKAGQIYVLDRVTGKPLTEVREIPVKAANIPLEQYSTTQPLSVGMPQIGAQRLREADMWGATPFDQLLCRIAFKKMRYEGLYTAPGTDRALSFPGSLGGMNWGGISVDPVHGFIFLNDMRLGLWIQMTASVQHGDLTAAGGESVNTGMGAVPLKGTPYSVNKDRFLSLAGVPCQAPPYGTLTAVNMKTGKIAWQVPVGTVRDTGPLGIKMRLPIPIGMPTLGGTLATQGGLVFIAGTQDYYLRAFDTSNGKEAWKGRLPVGSQGGPMTYQSRRSGRQYVVVSAGGARQSPDRGDFVIAYALPARP
jgi:quinate dehydrogenase (quinone)